MIIPQRIRLYPTMRQAQHLRCACGVARFAYNWALAEWERQRGLGIHPSEAGLQKLLNSVKRKQFPWMLAVTKCAPQQAIKHLGIAFSRFFSGKSRYPRKHKKGSKDSFYIGNDQQIRVVARRLRIPKLGEVRLAEPLRVEGRIISVVVSRQADFWFASISVEVPDSPPVQHHNENQVVGVDLGISTFATLSTGEKIIGPSALKKKLSRLRRAQRKMCRREVGSGRRERARHAVARIHYRIWCTRQDFIHKLTTRLTREFGVIVIENLNIRGMLKNRKLARSVSDQGFGVFRGQLKYKAPRTGSRIILADRFYPSSKMCSSCGYVLSKLSLKTREWTCPMCGKVHDRDFNAALNLSNLAGRLPVTARGADIRPAGTGAAALKREISHSDDITDLERL